MKIMQKRLTINPFQQNQDVISLLVDSADVKEFE